VLHPVTAHDHEVAAVEADRHLHGQLPVARREQRVQIVLQLDQPGRVVEVGVDRFHR
jgi:hypothetical protein